MMCSEKTRNVVCGSPRRLAVTTILITGWMLLIASLGQAQTYRVIHTFSGGYDGATPLSGLIIDRSGNLYGTAYFVATTGEGVIWQITP